MKRVKTWVTRLAYQFDEASGQSNIAAPTEVAIDSIGSTLIITVYVSSLVIGSDVRRELAPRLARNVLHAHFTAKSNQSDWVNFLELKTDSWSSIHTFRIQGKDILEAKRKAAGQLTLRTWNNVLLQAA